MPIYSNRPRGPAGGDLSGSYPDPQVINLSGSATGSFSGSFIGDGSSLTGLPSASIDHIIFVTKGGNDSTGNGSITKPFLTVQAAINYASSSYPTFSEAVQIEIAPGLYNESVTLTRHNTYIVSSLKKAEQRSVTIKGNFTINCTAAAQKFNHIVGLEGIFFDNSEGATSPTLLLTGSATSGHLTYLKGCYVAQNSSGSNANAFKTSGLRFTDNVSGSKIVAQNTIFLAQKTGADVVSLDGGDYKFDSCEVYCSVTGSSNDGIKIVGETALLMDRAIIEIYTNGYAVSNASTKVSGTICFIGNSSLSSTGIGNVGIVSSSTDIVLWNDIFTGNAIATNYKINGTAGKFAYFSHLTSPSYLNAPFQITSTGITLVPLTETHGIIVASALSGNLSSSYLVGTIPVSKGGTGATTFSGNSLLIASGSNAFTSLTGSAAAHKYVVAWNATGNNFVLTASAITASFLSSSYSDNVIDVSSSLSSSSALRITQRGIGNAILVEDSTNPDATPFIITNTGKVGISTLTPGVLGGQSCDYMLQVGDISTAGKSSIGIVTSGSNLAEINFGRSGSGTDPKDIYRGYISYDHLIESLSFGQNGMRAITISGSQNVGIGTFTPEEKLTVNGNVKATNFIGNGSQVTNITASNIPNFTTDVRNQFSAGTNIGISGGVISVTGSTAATVLTSGSVTGSGVLNNEVRLKDTINVTSITASNGLYDYIDFNTSSVDPGFRTGRFHYGTGSGDIEYDTDINGVTLKIGQQTILKVHNNYGSTLSKGMLIRFTTGNSSAIPFATTASWVSEEESAHTIGMVMANIVAGQDGYIILEGVLVGVDTAAYSAGDLLFLSSSGLFSNTPPSAGTSYHGVRVGQVVRSGNSNTGVVFVKVDNGYEINELHDTDIISPTHGDLFMRSGSVNGSAQWINTKQLSGSYGLTGSLYAVGNLSASAGVTGSFSGSGVGITGVLTASFATSSLTASYINPLTQSVYIVGNLSASAGITGSFSGSGASLDLFSTTNGTRGVVPGSSGNTSYFLKGDGTWAVVGGTLTGGVTNYIPKWNSATSLTSSVIYENPSNNRIGIGTASPTQELTILGSLSASNTIYAANHLSLTSQASSSGTDATSRVTGSIFLDGTSVKYGTADLSIVAENKFNATDDTNIYIKAVAGSAITGKKSINLLTYNDTTLKTNIKLNNNIIDLSASIGDNDSIGGNILLRTEIKEGGILYQSKINLDSQNINITAYDTGSVTGSINLTSNVMRLNTNAIAVQGGNVQFDDTYGVTFANYTGTTGSLGGQDSRTIKDYEEGRWTPVIEGSTTTGTGTYSIQKGRYIKIGNMVYIEASLAWSAHTGAGVIRIGGLPFARPSTTYGSPAFFIHGFGSITTSAGSFLSGRIIDNSSFITLYQTTPDSTGGTNSTVNFDTGGGFVFCVSYSVV